MNNWRDKIEKIVGCKTIDYLVEDDVVCSGVIPNLSQIVVFSMLHNLVMIRAASMCTALSCFLESTDALSHTESQYSNSGRTKDMYIYSNDLRLTLNFRARSKLSLVQAFVVIA